MTTTVTCAMDLLTHPDFIGFCGWWQSNLRCPLPFGDFLRECGLEEQAKVADWAYNEPDRRCFGTTEWGGVRPYKWNIDGWDWLLGSDLKTAYSDELEQNKIINRHLLNKWDTVPDKTFPQAIAILLDHYRPEGQ